MRKKIGAQIRRKFKRGFTLIELLITVFIGIVILSVYLTSNITLQQTTEEAFERVVAAQDAQQVIERIRNAAKTGAFPANVTGSATYANSATFPEFDNLNQEQVQVRYANPAADPLDATVSVTWVTYGGRQDTLAVRALVTQR